jgi:transposase InsO family protein/DNA-binding XRE family transcriptional regulator
MRSVRSGRLGFSPDSAGPVDPLALPALHRATRLLGLALGSALSRLRGSRATAARLAAAADERALLLRMAREAAEILGARWDKVPERHRPHYQPEQRYRILRIRNLLGLSQRETAQLFRVSIETIARWEKDGTDTEGEVHRPLVAAIPPVRRFADVVRATVKTMELAGFGGNDLIARTLARAGWKLSSRTVGRIRRERWPVPRLPVVAPTVPRAVRARYPNHVWMVDLTDVRGLFGIMIFKVGAVFDVFSRMPFSVRVFSKEPTSVEVARFVSMTAKRHGRPAHFVSDQARCFKSRLFRSRLRKLGVKQRFGAVGKKGSIALIERLWRTLKDTLGLRLLRPLVAEDLMKKIELGLVHYGYFRPHQALGGATPAEIYFGRQPAHLSAVPPPRGWPGDGPSEPQFRIVFLDPERRLPVLLRDAA